MAERSLVELRLKGEPRPGHHPVATTGFRAFFLLAAAFATLSVPLWLGMLTTGFTPELLPAARWHGHEMLFGYATAVLAGFFLTAVPKWTGRPTAEGPLLLGMAGLWVLGRLAMAAPAALAWPAILVDAAFLPLLAAVIARPVHAAKSKRNMGFAPLLLLMAAGNLAMHLEARGIGGFGARGEQVALDCVLFVMVIVGGRIIPLFTGNATGAEHGRIAWAERGANPAFGAVLAADLLGLPATWTGVLAGVAGLVLAVRMSRWGGESTLKSPILWVLHAAYALLAAGLVLRGLTAFGLNGGLDARHALTAGAVGLLTLGMMARVSLGHTGRTLEVPVPVTFAFVLVLLAGLLRTATPALGMPLGLLHAAGGLWTLGFGIFTAVYAPILWKPRVDGKPG